jgi:hypothetical protein
MLMVGLHRPASAAGTKVVGKLMAESFVFWDGGRVGDLTDRAAGLPSTLSASCVEAGPCYAYKLRLAEKGARLRVAIDIPQRRDTYRITIVDPHGTSTQKTTFNAFNAEVFVPKPDTGMWTIVVAPLTAEHSTFRLRAKLEAHEYSPSKAKKLWAPNLIVPRLWEFGFVSPVTGLAGFSSDDANPPVDAAGHHLFSCTFDETAEGAHRCLRFSFQLSNAGDGNFDVRFNTTGNPQQGAMVQCVERPGKAPLARPAGEYWFHSTHGHYHYQDVVLHQLFRVTNRKTGAMALAGNGQKLGYRPADQGFARWDRFVQGPSGTSASAGNCYAGSNNQIGLSRGWGDAYRWQRPGNFVEFGNNPDGWYVVRTTADPTHHLLETDESDNMGYAYVRVIGDYAQLLETGIGSDPWDPHKIVSRYSP